MGLGKSFTTIALLHTLFYNPSLVDNNGTALIRTALLVVPVNTIASWKHEINKWTKKRILIFELQTVTAKSGIRPMVVDQWFTKGGVLLVSKDAFQKYTKDHPMLLSPGPDILVLDEAHLMLSNKSNVIYKALEGIKTKRRLLLTGSPFQNNTMEYYRMIHFMRPGILDTSESAFEKEFGKLERECCIFSKKCGSIYMYSRL